MIIRIIQVEILRFEAQEARKIVRCLPNVKIVV
jgi:hypothetical protein